MPEACHLLVKRLLGMPAAPLFAEDCNSNDICELFIGSQCRSCNPYKISHYFSSLAEVQSLSLSCFVMLLTSNVGSRLTYVFWFCLLSSCIQKYFYYSEFKTVGVSVLGMLGIIYCKECRNKEGEGQPQDPLPAESHQAAWQNQSFSEDIHTQSS